MEHILDLLGFKFSSELQRQLVLAGVIDHLDGQVQAMLIAMYSRSSGTILDKIPTEETTEEEMKEKFGTFYVGYSHKSVGQLGTTTVFFEGVSQLAAKAIENNQLFNGQESSTRYIDFTSQPMINLGKEDFIYWQEKWRDFYTRVLSATIEMIKEQFPYASQPEGTKETVWERTVRARAFDICRGFLPAGVTTCVGFSGTFDTLNDHLGEMIFHPCEEMAILGVRSLTNIKYKYDYAVDINKAIERNSYKRNKIEYFYETKTSSPSHVLETSLELFNHPTIDSNREQNPDDEVLIFAKDRKVHQKLPKNISDEWGFKMAHFIDFGSFRDIHRHRKGNMPMPLLTTRHGMHNFYKSNIPDSFKSELETLLTDYEVWYRHSLNKETIVDLQYTVPMGYIVQFYYSCDLNQLIYLLELRSSKTVHQTLRHVMQDMANELDKYWPELREHIYVDMDKENFTLKRGTQTFVGM